MDTIEGNISIVEPDELVARAIAIKPSLRARQRETECNRRVSDETVAELKAAGLYKVIQPARYGGYELDLWTFARCASEIGAGCGSTGWVYATAAQHQWQIGMFDDQAQAEVWADTPEAISASSYSPGGTAVEVDGGYRISGKWLYCSGVLNADWMILGAKIAKDFESEPYTQGYILVPKTEYQVEDNWDVVGLIGTGSSDVIINDLFVPSHRMLTLNEALSGKPPGAAVNGHELWRIPFFAAISLCLCAPAMGMAQGALETYRDAIGVRKTRGAALSQPQSMAEFPTIQVRVAEASAAIDSAKMLVRRDCQEIMKTMAEGRELSLNQRARNKGDLSFAVKMARGAVDLLYESVGGAGLSNDSNTQRYWRDVNSASKHISMNWDMCSTLYGRVLLGLPSGTAQF
ncbi:MAG: Flavin-dependent monooxygenase, oxygenase subunit HsaA [Alphaproteobacteria bacterium MarineAlpha11_Bin1]|nr:MAG: Flavin-dependent monooxygenase, oxygenase subunit HsaA [Alphaproteobacteria bacterium MarineAlpha11_Bin1]|tara:strand:+ start:7552 stop:8763 length:1212 start_codon:yes stop_codon:yes gene_type:complete